MHPKTCLIGDFSDISLADLIRVFQLRKATGLLQLDDKDPGGLIYFQDGKMKHALLGSILGLEAIKQLLLKTEGGFSFMDDVNTDEDRVDKPWQAIVVEGLRHMKHFSLLNYYFPVTAENSKFTLNSQKPAAQLTSQEIQLLRHLVQPRTIAELQASTGISGLDLMIGLMPLLAAGIIREIKAVRPVFSPKEKPGKKHPREVYSRVLARLEAK